jgi:hypothetical protein
VEGECIGMLRDLRNEERRRECEHTLLRCFAMDSVCRAEGTTTAEGDTLR